ncbi:MAG: Hsp33 family molecular chaperone HslO [Acidobacteriota bacterium]
MSDFTGNDILIRATAADAMIRCMAAVTTQLVNESCQRHGTLPTASAALGRTLTGAIMLGTLLKDLEKITVQFHCQGPIGNITAEADAHGNVRGYVTNPQVDLPPNQYGKWDVGGAVGSGMLYVIRDAGFEIGLYREPYCGSVPITSGEISADFAYYLTLSEQIPSAVSIGVYIDRSYQVTAAGGFIIQMMPGADEKLIEQISNTVAAAPSSTQMIRDGFGPQELLSMALGEIGFEVLEQKPVRFHCHCSQERALRIVAALGEEEVSDMLDKDGGAQLNCHFCNSNYHISTNELEQILSDLSSAAK